MSRILSVINLCIIFTLIIWYGGYPFLGELYEYKERSQMYREVMGGKERFEELPLYVRERIRGDYQKWELRVERNWWRKIGDSLVILAFAIPAYMRAWIVFSLVISVLVLRNRPYVREVLWVMPVVGLGYAITNIVGGYAPIEPLDRTLFPSEGALIERFVEAGLSAGILEQQKELSTGWNKFLVGVWANEEFKEDETVLKAQIEKGKFNFTLARLMKLGESEIPSYFVYFHQKRSLYGLTLFFMWNLIFCFFVYRDMSFATLASSPKSYLFKFSF